MLGPNQIDLSTLDRVIERVTTHFGQEFLHKIIGYDNLIENAVDIAAEMKLRYAALIASDLCAVLGPGAFQYWLTKPVALWQNRTPETVLLEATTMTELQELLVASLAFASELKSHSQ